MLCCPGGVPAFLGKASGVGTPVRFPHSERVEVVSKQAKLIRSVSSQAAGACGGEMVPGKGKGASRRWVTF